MNSPDVFGTNLLTPTHFEVSISYNIRQVGNSAHQIQSKCLHCRFASDFLAAENRLQMSIVKFLERF